MVLGFCSAGCAALCGGQVLCAGCGDRACHLRPSRTKWSFAPPSTVKRNGFGSFFFPDSSGPLGSLWVPLGASWVLPGCLLGVSWVPPGPSWCHCMCFFVFPQLWFAACFCSSQKCCKTTIKIDENACRAPVVRGPCHCSPGGLL